MPRKELSKKDERSPRVPSESEWRRAPFFAQGDMFWRLAEHFGEEGSPLSELGLVEEEAEIADSLPIPADSIIRFNVKQRRYPYSFMEFGDHRVSSFVWMEWTDYVLGTPAWVLAMGRARVLHSVRLFRSLSVPRDLDGLGVLVSRWSASTYTFVTAWGEFTPTLEDVGHLLGLSLQGSESPFTWSLSAEEEELVGDLQTAEVVAKTFGSWFERDGSKRCARERREQVYIRVLGPLLF